MLLLLIIICAVVNFNTQVAALVEKQTREQASCSQWFEFRAGRATASNAKSICRTSKEKPAMSLLKKVCYPAQHQFVSIETNWGKNNEERARKEFVAIVETSHQHFKCRASGLQISTDYSFLAASPDGVVSCACCGEGLLEIKCPFTCRFKKIDEVANVTHSCLVSKDGVICLDKDHANYYQVQMQMFVSKRNFSYFVVWTMKDIHVERVTLDVPFCLDMVGLCKDYFLKIALPELVYKYWTRKDQQNLAMTASSSVVASVGAGASPSGVASVNEGASTSGVASDNAGASTSDSTTAFCYCGGEEYGDMIQCDGHACLNKWFHFQCVNLKAPPKAKKWFCHDCKNQKGRRLV